MAISDEAVRKHFSGVAGWLNSPDNRGLNSIVTMALLIWSADGQGATGSQIRKALLSEQADSLREKRFWRAVGLYRYWQRYGLPEETKANLSSLDAALESSLNWLASKKGITSQDALWKLNPPNGWDGTNQPADHKKIEEISRSIASAVSISYRGESVFTAADFARGIIGHLSPFDAEEFCAAAIEALSDQSKDKQSAGEPS